MTKEKTAKKALGWFRLDGWSPEEFAAAVRLAGATYEGSGVDKRTGDVEGFAVFDSAAKCESFGKKRRECTLIDYVT